MNIEETKEYKQLCECYNVGKRFICKYAEYDKPNVEGEEETWYWCHKLNKECWTYPDNDGCDNFEIDLPKFTPQKQLELIKLVGNKGEFKYEECYFDGEEDCLCVAVINCTRYDASGDDFDIALVRLLIRLQDVLNKSKVKEILEGDNAW